MKKYKNFGLLVLALLFALPAAAGNAKSNASTSSPKFLYFFIIQNQV